MKTKTLSSTEIKRAWHLVDAQDQILGRLAVTVANFLSGKQKIDYTPHLDGGDYVVVVNAAAVKVSGKKESRKIYYSYTGFPSGLRMESLTALRQRRPEEIIRRAVNGMLPRNRLHDRRLARLLIYKGSEHPHAAQLGGQHA